jgi:hypothetical protein
VSGAGWRESKERKGGLCVRQSERRLLSLSIHVFHQTTSQARTHMHRSAYIIRKPRNRSN